VAILGYRPRSGYLFLAVILGQLILISAQVNSHTGVPVLETITFGVLGQAQRITSTLIGGVRSAWSGYIGLRHAAAENEALKRELADVQIDLQQQRALASQSRELKRLLDLRDEVNLKTQAAEIVGAGVSPDFRTVTIDRGTREGVHANMAVIAPDGVVGRVVVTSAHAAKVQLLIDHNAAAGAIIERSRAQGVVVGGEGDLLRLEYVSEVADVQTGDHVVTSGIDGIFPKGFAIGTIESIEKSTGGYKLIVVRPAIDFQRLEQVLVVMSLTPVREVAEGSPE
jgi:rod shape-determining protein MreC